MLRIRKITDAHSVANKAAVTEAQAIMRAQFPGMAESESAKLPDQLTNPFRYKFVSQLLVAEDGRGRIKAIAILLYDPDLKFSFLEIISVAPGGQRSSGVGGALYDRLREEATALGSKGLYFECLPDDPLGEPDPATRRQNARRLGFYERYGAYPIVGTAYETPVVSSDTGAPYLVFDGLARHGLPRAAELRKIVRAILERKYGDVCPPAYIEKVVGSIRDRALALRPPRYVKPETAVSQPLPPQSGRIPLVVNDRHTIHHISYDRGYVEAPVRISSILRELDKSGFFERVEPKHFADRHIREVHDPGLIDYVQRACAETPENKSVYPYVFPIRNPQRKPKDRSVLAGYWCIDTFTPLNRNVWPAARQAVDCALTAAERIADGAQMAYALVRPPGHHAERRAFGGFCYINNGAVAAQYLSAYGRVAILDIDYHHGNGQQDIFYERDDVFTVSVHGHPSIAYPYFTGFRDETGRGKGAGYNLNIPLGESITPEEHRSAIDAALRRIAAFEPAYLVLSFGLDSAAADPTGSWSNRASDFRRIGRLIGEFGLPTLVVQEGGYRVRTLGTNARNFFAGLLEGAQSAREKGLQRRRPSTERDTRTAKTQWRDAVRPEDEERVRRLVAATGMFTAEEIAIAAELVAERVMRGRASGYEFVLAERAGRLAGYACFGPIAGTDASYDLYWIAVAPELQGSGLGREILTRTRNAVARRQGTRLYADTSSTPRYLPTRAFYERTGFRKAAELADFYRPRDGKVIYAMEL